MSRDRRRLIDYLGHMLEAVQQAGSYVVGMDESEFLRNRLVQDAVIRNIEIVGEASRNIERHYPEYVRENPDVPFSAAYEMRNVLAHGYFKVDLQAVWLTVKRDLPAIAAQITPLLAALRQQEGAEPTA
ncbi:DUF86 domain-containing protein [Cupriavidus gilardii]|uniref:HepT-like ribonuclease domain-containing protein n=1 Tax=Cupriavidus gilardii TaxID=82541 RepID=UPI001EE56F8D|nr:DUF86 domain-containing protein [Cupriavidus gilardii]MCG5259510.1 DUF86 domain-containing protein [Cupriavidus gilardii]MDF9429592.1 DUF86 domain-containing protein [Cupriavidus gilardii]